MRKTLPWYERASNVRSAKIGTMPAIVQVHGSDLKSLKPGHFVRIREAENGKWSRVYVNRVDESGYFQADR